MNQEKCHVGINDNSLVSVPKDSAQLLLSETRNKSRNEWKKLNTRDEQPEYNRVQHTFITLIPSVSLKSN